MATAGSLPPLSSNGKTFINDPKITLTNETKASIKLKFLTPKDKEVIVVRNFQLSIKNRKYEFKRLEQVLKSFNQNGELVTINSSCMDIDKQIPLLMHASKAILENVIFCHQEEINWPFSEAGNLKKVFDEIFDTAKYTKALEELKDTNKIYKEKSKDLKNKIELIKKDVEQYNKVKHMIELSEKKVFELNDTGKSLDETYKNSSKDLEKILELEKNYKEYENGIKLAKAKKEEKKNQMETILSDPMFEDYTKDEITFKQGNQGGFSGSVRSCKLPVLSTAYFHGQIIDNDFILIPYDYIRHGNKGICIYSNTDIFRWFRQFNVADFFIVLQLHEFKICQNTVTLAEFDEFTFVDNPEIIGKFRNFFIAVYNQDQKLI